MLDELRPLSLTETARRLGVDPFEVVRLMVVAGHPRHRLGVDAESLVGLREVGGIDESWWSRAELPEDRNVARQRVRAALQQLLDRGFVGESRTRLDNVWRGLPDADQTLVQRALTALTEEGHLTVVGTETGLKVSVNAASVDTIRKIAAGKADSPGLSALWQG